MRILIGHWLVIGFLLWEPLDARASVGASVESGASILKKHGDLRPLLPNDDITSTPDCTQEMDGVEGSTDFALRGGLLVVHLSDVERRDNHDEGASACHRWSTKARFDSKSIDLDELDEGYKRLYADITLTYRFVHLGEDRRVILDPGVNLVVGGDSPPKVSGWVNFSAHPRWEFRFEYRHDRAAYEVEDRLHMEARAIRWF